MMRRKSELRAAVGAVMAALLLAGCSSQSVTYDASAVSKAETPLPTETVTATPSPEITSAPVSEAAVTETPTETPSPEPTLTPIAPIEVTETPDPDKGLALIGEKAEGENIYKVRLENKTGRTITWFSVRDSFTDNYPSNMLEEDGLIRNDEKRVLYYDASHGMSEAVERDEEAQYDIRINLQTDEELKDEEEEGIYLILHHVPFTEFAEAAIYYNGDVAFLKYTPAAGGAEVSTEETEEDILAEFEADQEEEESSDDSSSEEDSGQSSDDAQEENTGTDDGSSAGQTDTPAQTEEQTGEQTDGDNTDTGETDNQDDGGQDEVPEDEQYTAFTEEDETGEGSEDGDDEGVEEFVEGTENEDAGDGDEEYIVYYEDDTETDNGGGTDDEVAAVG